MKPGALVRARIRIADYKEVVTVPRHAVFEGHRGPVVYRRTRSGFEAVPVTLGEITLGRAVITSGLETGDIIALVDPSRAQHDEIPAKTPDGIATIGRGR
jgi:cobalt-zinc-cadmium efflux system membrane fusion protein